MRLYIKNIILYPKDRELSPRVITFKEDKINIITGYSQRGKSAIIDIIDYCLGSGECNIPVGTIRNTVEVFALYVKFNNEYLFIGRENYDESKSTMYFYKENEKGEDLALRTNKWLENKSAYKQNTEYIKRVLSEMSGFKNLKQMTTLLTPLIHQLVLGILLHFNFRLKILLQTHQPCFIKLILGSICKNLKPFSP